MKKTIVICIILGAIIVAGFTVYTMTRPQPVTARLEGTITAVSTDCWFDGTCGILVDDTCAVVTDSYPTNERRGEVTGIEMHTEAYKEAIGKRVQVYAKKISYPGFFEFGKAKPACYLSVFGSRDYYIKVLE